MKRIYRLLSISYNFRIQQSWNFNFFSFFLSAQLMCTKDCNETTEASVKYTYKKQIIYRYGTEVNRGCFTFTSVAGCQWSKSYASEELLMLDAKMPWWRVPALFEDPQFSHIIHILNGLSTFEKRRLNGSWVLLVPRRIHYHASFAQNFTGRL